ncbi:DNA replication protein [Myotisia sp. PD_48]|nr:DNA replication protein [Myotisia sp. PD_48]
MAYYDVDAILTDAQKLSCTFELDIPKLGFLDGNAGEDVKKGMKVELPLWLGEILAVGARAGASPPVTLDLPKALSEQVINALKAGPKSVDLRSQAPHFYQLGARVLQLFEEEEMVDIISHTFKTRALQIADHAHNLVGAQGIGMEFLRGLDETERQLFRTMHTSVKDMQVCVGESKK